MTRQARTDILWRFLPLPVLIAGAFLLVWLGLGGEGASGPVEYWQRAVNPGPLSNAHAFLENNCAACHTPVQGVSVNSCILCHANDETLLQRQPTAFHADIRSCSECHMEHQGRGHRPTVMDHEALVRIGLRELEGNLDARSEETEDLQRLHANIGEGRREAPLANPHLSAQELTLDCASCHQNDDRHFQLFGNDCASCHAATSWTLPEFRHPPASSMDCAQCHQAPPSHYMKHFNMVSQKVAGQPGVTVDKCYVCHQTTSWPDIRGVGWYKHH